MAIVQLCIVDKETSYMYPCPLADTRDVRSNTVVVNRFEAQPMDLLKLRLLFWKMPDTHDFLAPRPHHHI